MDENIDEIEIEDEVVEEEGLRDKLKKIRDDLKICRKEKDEYLAGWQRAKADFINARKEDEKSREAFTKFAQSVVLMDLLVIADSLEMSIKHLALQAGGRSDGTKEIYSQLKEILKRYGVTEIESAGKKFDPVKHEAIEKIEVEDESKDDMVIEALQKGWLIFDKVLRPAKVKVGIFKN